MRDRWRSSAPTQLLSLLHLLGIQLLAGISLGLDILNATNALVDIADPAWQYLWEGYIIRA